MNAFLQSSGDILIYIAIFLGALLAYEGIRQILSREEDRAQAKNRRMRARQKGKRKPDVEHALMATNAAPGNTRPAARFARMLRQAGLALSPRRFVMGQIAIGLLAGLALLQVLPGPMAIAGAVVAGAGLPLGVVAMLRAQRLERLTAQLPDALDLMARGLSVGHPLSVTIGNVAADMSDPIGSEFGYIQDQVAYGDDITEAFAAFSDRVGTEDARYAAVSVGIQHGTGGNLAHILHVLSKVIRDRATMRKKIRAISAEGRLSAFILSILPFGIFGIINITAPNFYADVWHEPLFKFFAVAVLTLVALQVVILFRMVNFKF